MKRLMCLTIIMLLILPLQTVSIATNVEINTQVSLKPKINTIEENEEVEVEIYIKNNNYKIGAIDLLIDYNEDIFYELKEENIETNLDMYIFEYEEEYKNLKIVINESIEEGVVATIKLTPKKTLTPTTEKVDLLKLYDMYIVTEETYEETISELDSAIWTIYKENETPKGLYLSSDSYKIGNNDIANYEKGDKYISRVEEKTTKEEFIANLKTNGTIRIIKHDGTELGSNELVGTGMTLEVTKDEEKIELQIAVMGDLDGNGKVTATDLSTLNQTILKIVTLENEYMIAGDLDENEKITATDLSTLNKMLLKIL